jgi:predicted flap endonuclease-1-like 5' DNA nuclease
LKISISPQQKINLALSILMLMLSVSPGTQGGFETTTIIPERRSTMKRLSLFIIIGLFFVGLSGCSSTGLLNSVMSADSQGQPLLSAQDHLNHAQMLEQDFSSLKEQISRIDQKVARYEKKPYLDPKHFRRDGLKKIRGVTEKKIAKLQEQGAWHQAQASRLAALEQTSPEQPLDEKSVVKEQVSLSDSRAASGAPVRQGYSGMMTESSS